MFVVYSSERKSENKKNKMTAIRANHNFKENVFNNSELLETGFSLSVINMWYT